MMYAQMPVRHTEVDNRLTRPLVWSTKSASNAKLLNFYISAARTQDDKQKNLRDDVVTLMAQVDADSRRKERKKRVWLSFLTADGSRVGDSRPRWRRIRGYFAAE
jgi:hypothetical protein